MIKWLYDHYALTAIVSLYYMALAGYGTYHVFADVSAISGSAATAYATLTVSYTHLTLPTTPYV